MNNRMNGFIRSTHDENGKYRDLPEWKNELINGEYLHVLSKEPMSLDDILFNIKKYNEQFPDAPYSENKNDICTSLVDMLMYDMIRIKCVNNP